MDRLDILRFHARFIGAFALEDPYGRDVLPAMRKTRALLARIVLARGEALSRRSLIEFAWPDREPEQGQASLRQALYEARALTAGETPLLYASRTTVQANLAALDSDLDRLIAAARGDDLATLTQTLRPGLPPLLADLDGISPAIDAWLAEVRRALSAALYEAVSAAVARAQEGGRTAECAGLVAFLAAHPPPAAPVEATVAPRRTPRILLLASAAAVLLAGGVAAALWLRPTDRGRILDVEPLRAAAGDAPAQAVRLGLSGELTHALVGNPARIQVGQVGEPGVSPTGADLIISGDVATLGDRLQAHVQLARAHGGGILWAGDFTSNPGQPDILREQIATKTDAVINCALSLRHGGAARNGDEADRLYLKACDLIEQYRLEDALQPLRQVTVLEPGFARAWADLATTEALAAEDGDPARRAAACSEAAAHARRALALDPNTGLAYYALAHTQPGIANWQARIDTIAKGLKVEPDSSELNNAMAYELERVGRIREAIGYFRRSRATDPLLPVKTATLFTALAFYGELDEAEPMIDQALRLWPRNDVIWSYAFAVERRVGDPRRALAMLDDPTRPGARDRGEAELMRLMLRARLDPSPKTLAAAAAPFLDAAAANPRQDPIGDAWELAQLGQIDAAYRIALSATGDYDEDNDHVLFRENLAPFRSDPRFMTLAARLGLVAIWRKTGKWPDFCVDQTVPYDCQAVALSASR